MRKKKSIEVTGELLDKIISAAYGDADVLQKLKIKYLSFKDENIKRIYLDYKTSAKAVHSLKEKDFPERSSNNILSKIEAEGSFNSLPSKTFSILFSRPIISAAAAGIIIIVVVSLLFFNKQMGSSGNETKYSKAEIELAEKQAKESLALVGFAFNKTKNILEEEVIQERVGKPIKKGFDTINKLFSGG